jgi:glycosyltransferase involved in cell wall biosynthesis
MKQFKVLFIDHTAKLGGGEIALFNVLTCLDKERFRPILVLGHDGALSERMRKAGIETHVFPLSSHVSNTRKDSLGVGSLLRLRAIWACLAYSCTLASFIKAHAVDLIHTNTLKADLIGGVAGRLARVPVVWHVRDRIDDDYLPAVVVSAFRWLCRVIPDFVVANSAATLDTIRLPARTGHAVVHSGSSVIMNDSSALVHDGVQPRAPAAKRNPDAILVGLVGRIAAWKGQHVFLNAAAMVRQRFPSARFQIIGSAMFGEEAYEREIHALARSLGIEDAVEFMGFRADVPQLMKEFDMLVHASITGEPFGQVIIEAMAVAKPVVATRGGGVPEIVQDGVTGIMVPMGDAPAMAEAICQLLSDPARASAMGLAGRTRVMNHFTVRITARRLESVFVKVLERNGRIPQTVAPTQTAMLTP